MFVASICQDFNLFPLPHMFSEQKKKQYLNVEESVQQKPV